MKLSKQISHYFFGNVFLFVAALIAFPIFTRMLSVSDYGLMNLLNTTITLVSAIAICGFTQSSVRFYHEYMSGDEQLKFYSSLIFGNLAITSVITLAIISGAFIFNHYLETTIIFLLTISLLSVIPENMILVILSFYRAAQKTGKYNLFMILKKYSLLGLQLFFLVGLGLGLSGIFLGLLIVNVVGSLALLLLLFTREIQPDRYHLSFSKEILKEAATFGYPFIFVSILTLLLVAGDRYLIQYFLDSRSVGLYSASYNMCTLLQHLLVAPVTVALLPVALSIWHEKGERETQFVLSKILNYYLLLGIPIIFGFTALAGEMLALIATERYLEGVGIVPFIIISVIINGAYFITYIGLQIAKKTKIIAYSLLLAVLVNIALNVVLLPVFGITGAAFATLVAYIIFFVVITQKSFTYLKIPINVGSLLKSILSAAIMYGVVVMLPFSPGFLGLFLKILIGIIVYTTLLSILDKTVYRDIRQVYSALRQRSS